MKTSALLTTALAAYLSTGCAAVVATQSSTPTVSGELWYVKNRSLFGLVLSSSVYYCPPPQRGPATCVEAQIYDSGEAPESTETPAPNPATAPAEDPPIWRVATRAVDLTTACGEVKAMLAQDEECAGEQCRAPTDLIRLYIVRCREQASTDFAGAVKLRDLWRDRVEGDGGTCAGKLHQAIRDESAAEEYKAQCLKEREPGKLEKAILDGKGRSKKGQKKP
ncbi:MAG: hypothetical protein U0359_04325 [Byssovorax sp.]